MKVVDIMKVLRESGFEPTPQEDTEFAAVRGKYLCRFDDCGRIQGKARDGSDYDFRGLKMQVVEVVDGDKAMNRYLNKNYNNDEAGMKKLLDDLFTAGVDTKGINSDEELDQFLPTLKDKTVWVRAWVSREFTAGDGRVVPGGKQAVKIVKEFKGKDKAKTVKANVPF